MKWYCVRALLSRHMISMIRDFSRLMDLVYWPVFDIVTWGFTGMWLQQTAASSGQELPYMLLSSLIIWQITSRAQMELSLSLIEEMWSRNMVNLFSTPLTIAEWMITGMLLGIIKNIFTIAIGITIIWLLYSISILSLGLPLLLFVALAILNGWFIGFMTIAAVILGGQRYQSLIWMIGWFFAPLSAVFYPLSVLPLKLQKISYCLPMTYVFEGVRLYIATSEVPYELLTRGFCLSIIYVVFAMSLFVGMFHVTKRWGLRRLEEE